MVFRKIIQGNHCYMFGILFWTLINFNYVQYKSHIVYLQNIHPVIFFLKPLVVQKELKGLHTEIRVLTRQDTSSENCFTWRIFKFHFLRHLWSLKFLRKLANFYFFPFQCCFLSNLILKIILKLSKRYLAVKFFYQSSIVTKIVCYFPAHFVLNLFLIDFP